MHVYTEEKILYEYEKVVLDIDNSGVCTVVRKNKIAVRLQSDPLLSKKLRLYGGRSIQFYADKIGVDVADLNPDKEFQITARDISSGVKLDSSTEIEGENKDVLVTNVLFDSPLTFGGSLEIEIRYHNLDPAFYLTNLWEEPHLCRWFIKPDTQTKEMEAVIRFPETLPDWLAKSEIGVNPVPQDWVRADTCADHGRRCVFLSAIDLKVGISYKVTLSCGAASPPRAG